MPEDSEAQSDDATAAFRSANNARRRGDFAQANEILTTLLDGLRDSTDEERDALVAITESKREVLAAMVESKKRRAERNLRLIVRSYYRAARKLRLPTGSPSRQSAGILARRHLALSDARKWRAIEALQVQVSSVSDTLRSLQTAERHYRRAIEYASAATLNKTANSPTRHQRLLRYSHGTVRERLALLEYMLHGEESAYWAAEAAWLDAVQEATELCVENEASLFPNRFYCLKELELEGLFVRAARAFREQQWSRCCELLQQWVDELPVDFRWSWRDTNIRVRLLAARTLGVILASDGRSEPVVREHIRELLRLASSEPVGRVGRYLAREIAALPAKGRDSVAVEATLGALPAFFPLDSTVEYYDPTSAIDPFDSLSPRIRRGLSLPKPISRIELERAKLECIASIEALLGHVCDYDQQWSFPGESLPEPSVRNFLELCRRFRWYDLRGGSKLIERLETAMTEVTAASTAETFEAAYNRLRSAARHLLRFSPLVVTLATSLELTIADEYVAASPDWSISRVERDVLQISAASRDELPIPAGRYYLPPAWRVGNRMSYVVNRTDNSPLWLVRFSPRWEYWDDELNVLGPSRITGVPRRWLERAVELASRAVSEDGTIRPKVGAMIVRDGVVLAEAYRNEDGKGSHAEQLAFLKSGKQDLAGATVITTLEPCTGGRSNHTAACAELIVLKGIKQVVIGALDPNPKITTTAEFMLRQNRIVVERFPNDLVERIHEIDREHIDHYMKRRFRPVVVYR